MIDSDWGERQPLIGSNDHEYRSDDDTYCKWSIYYYSVSLIVFPLISIIFLAIALFGPSPTAFNKNGFVSDILLMITYASVVLGIITVILSDEKRGSHHNNDSASHTAHSAIAITFLFTLGVGDSLFNLTRFGDRLILVLYRNNTLNSDCRTEIGVSMVENLLKSFCQLCILMFIIYQLNSEKPKSEASKAFKTCLAIFCSIQWLQILLQEVDHHKNRSDSCILHMSDSVRSFEKIEPYLYPLGLEFRFASFIELLIMSETLSVVKKFRFKFFDWFKTKMQPASCICMRKMQAINNCLNTALRFIFTCFTKIKCPSGKGDELLASIFLPASGILLISLSMVIVLFQEFNTNDEEHGVDTVSDANVSLITLISEICEVILALLISLHSIYSLQQLCKKVNNPEQDPTGEEQNMKFKIDFSFLIIANLFLYTYCALTLVGSVRSKPVDKLTEYTRSLTLAASVIPIVQTTLQLIVIWKVRQNRGKLTEGINDMWIILSFAIWLFDTFSAKKYKTNQIQIDLYHGAWDVFAALFIPMAIFFRFHSCIIFANIKAGAYWDQHNHPEL